MKRTLPVFVWKLQWIAALLLLIGAGDLSAKVDVKNVNATVKTEDHPSDPDKKKVTVTVTYDLEGTVEGKGAVVSLDANLSNDAGSLTLRPLDSELEGDFGGVLGDGQKRIVWDATATLERNDAEGKYDCVIDISVEGQGDDPARAVLDIKEYDPSASWKYFTVGRITFSDLTATTKGAVCAQSDNWQNTPEGDARFFQGEIDWEPSYRGNRPNPVWWGPIRDGHCSGFLAAKDLGTAAEKIWINFAGSFHDVGTLPNGKDEEVDYVFQVRYNRVRSGKTVNEFIKMGNAGNPGEADAFSETTPITIYTVSVDLGKEDIESSNEFDLEVRLYEYEYFYNGEHVMTFKGVEGSYFEEETPEKFVLKDGKMVVNGWLRFEGAFAITETSSSGSFASLGAWKNPKGELMWSGRYDASLTDKITGGDMGNDPLTLATEWLLAGFSVALKNISFVGDVDQATGIKLDIMIIVPQLASGCNSNSATKLPGFALSGIDLQGVSWTDDGLSIERAEVENIGVKVAPQFCLRTFTIEYDKEKNKLDADIVVVAKPWLDKIEGSMTLIDGKPEAFELLIKDAITVPLAIPAPPPAHIVELSGLILGIKGMQTGPLNLKGGLIFSSNKKWAELPGYATLAKTFGDFELFEIKSTIEWTYPLVMKATVAPSLLSYKNAWLTNDQKIWLIKGNGSAEIGHNGSAMIVGAKVGLDILQFDLGKKPFFHSQASLSLSAGSNFVATVSATGEMNIPDLFTSLPLGDYLNHKLGLPISVGSAEFLLNNQVMTFRTTLLGEEGSCFVIDMSRDPLTSPHKFFHNCDGAELPTSRTERKGAAVQGANDTTWYEFAATSDMRRAVAQIYGNPAPASVLVNPSGAYILSSSTPTGITYYPSKKAGQSNMWEIEEPTAGVWKVGVVDMTANDSVDTWVVYKSSAPFAFQSSRNGKTITAEWTPMPGGGTEATVDFFLDIDGRDHNGFYIGTADESTGTFAFTMTDSLPDCGYYIYGMRNYDGALSAAYAPQYHPLEKTWLAPPTNIAASVATNGEVTVTWDHSPDTSRLGYLIRVSDAAGNDSIYASTSFGFAMATFAMENPQGKTLSILTYGDEGMRGCWSEPVSFQVSSVDEEPTAGDEGKGALRMHVRPNPTAESASIFVNLPKYDLLIVELYSVDGGRIETLYAGEHPEGTARAEFEVSHLQSGTYILRVTTTSGTATEKLVVRR